MSDIATPASTLPKDVKILDFTIISGMTIPSRASITLSVDGVRKIDEEHENGSGPIDAAVVAIKRIIPHDLGCDVLFEVIGTGTSARCNAHVTLSCGAQIFTAEDEDHDANKAAVKAYVVALDKYLKRVHAQG